MNTMNAETRDALNRLFDHAYRDTTTSRVVADFLLAWRNARVFGGFDLTHLWHIDARVEHDMMLVLRFISANYATYPERLGFEKEFDRVEREWRPIGVCKMVRSEATCRWAAVHDYLIRSVQQFKMTGELPAGSTTERLMIAFALERWDLVSGSDPLRAWFYNLNDAQRWAVAAYRQELRPHILQASENCLAAS